MSRGLRYRVIRKLAHGGMAEIFLAMQVGAEGFEKPVVLKRILPALAADPGFVRMLVDEAHIASRLSHSHIVQVLDLGQASDQFFLALEFVDGFSLEQIRLRARKARLKLPLPLALYVVSALCRGLDYAHRRTRNGRPLGIVHRDVTPQNVLVSREGDVKLADFGIAKARGRRERSATGVIKGKFAYMSPEQSIGAPLDARSDLFSVGTLLYVLTTGKKPFEGTTDLDVLMQVRKARYEKPSNLVKDFNPDVERFIARALRADRAKRFQSAEQMADRLDAILFKLGQPTGPAALKRWLETLCARDGVRPPGDMRDPSVSSSETLELASHELELQDVATPPSDDADADDDELSSAEPAPDTWRRAGAAAPTAPAALPAPVASAGAVPPAQEHAPPEGAYAFVEPGEASYTCVGTAPTMLSEAHAPALTAADDGPLGGVHAAPAISLGDEADGEVTRNPALGLADDDEADLPDEPELHTDAAIQAALEPYEHTLSHQRGAPGEHTTVDVQSTVVVGVQGVSGERAQPASAEPLVAVLDGDAHEAPTRVAHAAAEWLGKRTAPHAQLDVTPQLDLLHASAERMRSRTPPADATLPAPAPELLSAAPKPKTQDPTLVLPPIPARVGGHPPAPVYTHAALRSTLEAEPPPPLAFAGAGAASVALEPAPALRLRLHVDDDTDDTEVDGLALPESLAVRSLRALSAFIAASLVFGVLAAGGVLAARPYYPLWVARSELGRRVDGALAKLPPLGELLPPALRP
jgi:eukaryotic-like serine/threonine-protein kinase